MVNAVREQLRNMASASGGRQGAPNNPFRVQQPGQPDSAVALAERKLNMQNENAIMQAINDPKRMGSVVKGVMNPENVVHSERAVQFLRENNPQAFETLQNGVRNHISEILGKASEQRAGTNMNNAKQLLAVLKNSEQVKVLGSILPEDEMRYLMNGVAPRLEAIGIGQGDPGGWSIKPFFRGGDPQGNIRFIASARKGSVQENDVADLPLQPAKLGAERKLDRGMYEAAKLGVKAGRQAYNNQGEYDETELERQLRARFQ